MSSSSSNISSDSDSFSVEVLSSTTSSIGADFDSSDSLSKSSLTKQQKSTISNSNGTMSSSESSDESSNSPPIQKPTNNSNSTNSQKNPPASGLKLCIICYDEIINKVALECKHEFCFSCIKGSLIQNGTECPLCRHKISSNYRNMILKTPEKLCGKIEDFEIDDDAVWIYSGKHSGWWYFDPKANKSVEELYQLFKNKQLTNQNNQVSICGYLFSFNFDDMEQKNKQNGAIRHVKRLPEDELEAFQAKNQIKGICGIKV